MKRVVITGLACISGLGNGVSANWNKLIEGKSGISKISGLKDVPVSFGGLVQKLPDLNENAMKLSKYTSRSSHFALAVSEELITSSNILTYYSTDRIGVSIGTGMSSIQETIENWEKLKQFGVKRVSPHFVPRVLSNSPSSLVSICHNLHGPNQCISSGCTTGAASIGEGYFWIKNGLADAVVAGATESSLDSLSIGGFCQSKALASDTIVSAEFDGNCQLASRPFDKNRKGFVMGEGAALIILEDLEAAKRRKATIYAEIIGYGNSSDAYHMTAPSPNGSGAERAIRNALCSSEASPDYINAHATSTKIGDAVEISVIERLFNHSGEKPLFISSSKASIGHLLGAAGAIECIHTALALYHGIVPPTINFSQFERALPKDFVISSNSLNCDLNVAITNSFGFGGNNICLALKRF